MSYTNYGNITIDNSYYTGTSYTIDTTTNPLGILPMSGTVLGGAIGNPYTITGSNGTWGGLYSSNTPTVTLDEKGIEVLESADIKLGNISLKDFINRIEQRLALLNPNPELEKEWTELKELGDRYRELEKQITEKMKTWDILKRED